jgi:hypothetical protein
MSDDGGLEELPEFFWSRAISSRAAFRSASSSAIRARAARSSASRSTSRFSSSAIRLSLASIDGILPFFAYGQKSNFRLGWKNAVNGYELHKTICKK